jgi:predicted RNA-binding Zn-ribbon protein involved in translation (DUF1610 family)
MAAQAENKMPDSKRIKEVRAERVDTTCGAMDHMTVDEIKRRTVSDDVELTCPECGEVHLTPEEASEAAERKVTETERYKTVKKQAEQD